MDKSALTAYRVPTGEVELPGIGTIKIRGLTRVELLLAGKNTEDPAVMERRMLAYAMVDPEMTERDVEAWQKASPAQEMAPVVAAVNELSGIGRDVQKEAYKSLRDEPGSGV